MGQIILEPNAYCEYCGEEITRYDDITICENYAYHSECLDIKLNQEFEEI